MSHGTIPPGAHSEEQVARWVRGMFDRVAPRYDFLNHLLSLNIDRWWRRRTVRRLLPLLQRPDARVLDLCCGSGDLLLALQKAARGTVHGSDFSHNMLLVARKKIAARGYRSEVFEADALQLPLADGSLDLVTVAFGFRNFASYRRGLAEFLRVLKPGGTAAILEFSTPPNALFRGFYNFYSRRIVPRIGAFISGSADAYSYLPESVRKFPDAPKLAADMRAAGFSEVSYRYMTVGIVALHIARR